VTQALGGVGLAFVFVPVSVVLLAGIEQTIVPSALALTRLMQQIGASVGSAYAATLLDRNFNAALSNIAGSINASRTNIAAAVMAHGSQALAQLDAMANAQAANLAAMSTMQFFALATLATTILPMLMVRRAMAKTTAQAMPTTPIRVLKGSVTLTTAR